MAKDRVPTREEFRAMSKEEFYAWKSKNDREIASLEADIARGPTLEDLQSEQVASDEKLGSWKRKVADADRKAQEEEIGGMREVWAEMGENPAELEELIAAAGGASGQGTAPQGRTGQTGKTMELADSVLGNEGDGYAAERERQRRISELYRELEALRDEAIAAWDDAEAAGASPDGTISMKRHREYAEYRLHLQDEFNQEIARVGNVVRPKLPTYKRLALAMRVEEWLGTEIAVASGDPEFLAQVARDGGNRDVTLSNLRDIRHGVEALQNKFSALRILISSGIQRGVITAETRDALIRQLNEDFGARLTAMDDPVEYPTTQSKLAWIAEEDAYLDEETARVTGQIAQFKV